MKTINWNQMSELGLIAKINKEVLHPLGLAISRDPHTGKSNVVLVADDGVFEYPEGEDLGILSEFEIRNKLRDWL